MGKRSLNDYTVSTPNDGTVLLTVSGDWSIQQAQPSLLPLERLAAQGRAVGRVQVDGATLAKWDSALLSFLFRLFSFCRERKIAVDDVGLPQNARQLLGLALAGPQRGPGAPQAASRNPVRRLGESLIRKSKGLNQPIAFVGDTLLTLARAATGRARFRTSDVFLMMQECGAEALPIVGIISFLVGMIFAFVGALQLKQFGADIYDANLVAVAMFREMAAVMTGIVLAGRTGAAFAAQISSMQGNEEIDSLSTLGISPMEFLVLPRTLALIIMMPLLCVYANALGLIGGYVVAMGTLNVTSAAYILQTQSAVTLTDFTIGIVKGSVFGVLIAVTGCLQGMQAGRSAAAVGAAATSAVVSGILAIIITDAVFAVLLNVVGL